MEKNEVQISGFAVAKEAQSPCKKIFSKKNSFTLFVQIYDLQNGVRNIFKNKWVSRYLSFGDFKVPKNSSSQ